MGNQNAKQASRYRPNYKKQNFSLDIQSNHAMLKNYQNQLSIYNPPSSQRNRKKSFNASKNDQSILHMLNQSKDNRQVKANNNNPYNQNNKQFLTVDYHDLGSNKNNNALQIKNRKQKDRILQKLSKKNEQLRRQLKGINEQLTQKLKRKKLIPKTKKLNGELQSDQQRPEVTKQKEAKSAGLRRQLQNGYKQIDMYKRTLIELKSKQQTEVSSNKVKQMQNQITQLDRIIDETIKKINGIKNINKHQERNLEVDINQDLVDNLQILKNQEEDIKSKIKQINKKNVQRQNNYKKQQAYLFQVQKKYREISGQYFPQLKKKSPNQQSTSGKKPSTFDRFSSHQKKKQGQQYPTIFQIQTVTNQLTQLRNKHQQYHKKINFQLQGKNKIAQDLNSVIQQIKGKDKIIQSLKNKLTQIRKIIKPNKKSLFGYDSYEGSQLQSQQDGNQDAQKQIQEQHQQDQFDIKHLIANIPKPIRLKPVQMQINNSIRSGVSNNKSPSDGAKGMVITGQKSQPKVWGNVMTRRQQKGKNYKNQLGFDDNVQFQNNQIQPLIIGINIWVNKNGQILAIQAIYLNKDQIRYGVKSSSAADGFIVRYDLQAPDYLKNITGGFNQSGVLQYIAFFSKKGKAGTFGNKRDNQQAFTFGLAANQRPFRFNGASIMIQSQPRINRIGVQICSESIIKQIYSQ